MRRVQDSVHGLMEFHGVESVLIDVLRTREIQRLTQVKQTGLAYLVFPGAEHSRFAHSLGSGFLALRFGRHLQEAARGVLADLLLPTEVVVRDLGVAALCHDLGHGPLSHAWEREIVGAEFDRASWIQELGLASEADLLRDAKWHELVGQGLLAWEDGELHTLLEQHESGFSGRVRQMLRGQYFLNYLPRLLSSDIDVDRADYMMRDAWQSGVAYGRYDLNWLISTCSLGTTDAGELVVGFDRRKATKVVEQFLVARSALYDTVYHHKTVRAAEGLLEAFLRRCKDVAGSTVFPREKFIEPVVRVLNGNALRPHELLDLNDAVLWAFIADVARSSATDSIARNLAGRLLTRDLFKQVPVSSDRLQALVERPDGHRRINRVVQPFVDGDPQYYVHLDRVDFSWFDTDPRHSSFFVENGHASPIRYDDALEHFPQVVQSSLRLYSVREAVEPLRQLIG